MHVAHFVHRYPPAVGGAEAYVARLGAHLAARGDGVTVWTTTALDLAAMWHRGFAEVPRTSAKPEGNPAVRRYPPLRLPGRRYLLKALTLLPNLRLRALAMPCNPVCPAMWQDAGRYDGPLDAVHAFAFPYAFPILCGLRLARRRGVPFLLTPFLHLGDPDDPRDPTRRQYTAPHLAAILREADRVFVQTPSEFRAVVGLGVPEKRVVLQGLGVDPAECTGGNRTAVRAMWRAAPTDAVIGHLANLSAEKGTIDLLRATTGVPAWVVLAGPAMPGFERFWKSYRGKGRVIRLGPLTDQQRRDFFAGIDVLALPSRTDSFGLVLLEAWANGKPVVAYRAGGPADLVRDGDDGFLAPCGAIGPLADHLWHLTHGWRLRNRLGDAGRDRVGREFAWADKLELVREAAREAAAESPRGG